MKIRYIISISLLITLFCNSKTNPEVRHSTLAGSWYSKNPKKLASNIDGYLSKASADKEKKGPLILIQPHAGHVYSGQVAAAGYKLIIGSNPDIIIILAPSHQAYFKGCSISTADYYETPLGRVKIDKKIVKQLRNESLFKTVKNAHIREHSIEIHLPFLQRIFGKRLEKDISIIPILVGNINKKNAKSISDSIINAVSNKKRPLFIISSDFTHYGSRFGYLPFTGSKIKSKIKELDYGAINHILKKDVSGFSDYIDKTGATICGRNPIKIALSLPVKNFSAKIISYDTSGNITGDFSNTVSYASIVFYGNIDKRGKNKIDTGFNLSPTNKKYLLDLAKKNITSLLEKKKRINVNIKSVPENCKYETGVFVTLKKKGRLRGCIGYVIGRMPLYKSVIDNSYNAAFKDPRFPALIKEELKDIKIEISVLTIPEQIKSIDEIKVGRDGLIIEKGFRKGLLLPQVPTEWGWNKEEFLIHTCRKAGLPDYAWKHGAKILRFEAIVFGEE